VFLSPTPYYTIIWGRHDNIQKFNKKANKVYVMCFSKSVYRCIMYNKLKQVIWYIIINQFPRLLILSCLPFKKCVALRLHCHGHLIYWLEWWMKRISRGTFYWYNLKLIILKPTMHRRIMSHFYMQKSYLKWRS
jgi:hypothetical protein